MHSTAPIISIRSSGSSDGERARICERSARVLSGAACNISRFAIVTTKRCLTRAATWSASQTALRPNVGAKNNKRNTTKKNFDVLRFRRCRHRRRRAKAARVCFCVLFFLLLFLLRVFAHDQSVLFFIVLVWRASARSQVSPPFVFHFSAVVWRLKTFIVFMQAARRRCEMQTGKKRHQSVSKF